MADDLSPPDVNTCRDLRREQSMHRWGWGSPNAFQAHENSRRGLQLSLARKNLGESKSFPESQRVSLLLAFPLIGEINENQRPTNKLALSRLFVDFSPLSLFTSIDLTHEAQGITRFYPLFKISPLRTFPLCSPIPIPIPLLVQTLEIPHLLGFMRARYHASSIL